MSATTSKDSGKPPAPYDWQGKRPTRDTDAAAEQVLRDASRPGRDAGRVAVSDVVIGSGVVAAAAGVVAVAAEQAGPVAAGALGAALVGLPALVGGIWALAHYQATGPVESEGGER